MTIRLIRRAAKVKRIADENLQEAQRRYKRDHAKKVSFEQTFASGNCVFVNQPHVTTTAAERLTSDNYSKLRSRRLALYMIIRVGPEFVKMNQDEITKADSISPVTHRNPLGGLATSSQVQKGEVVQAKNCIEKSRRP